MNTLSLITWLCQIEEKNVENEQNLREKGKPGISAQGGFPCFKWINHSS